MGKMTSEYTPLTFFRNVRDFGLLLAFVKDIEATGRSNCSVVGSTKNLASKLGFSERSVDSLGNLVSIGHAFSTLPAAVVGLAVVIPYSLFSRTYEIARSIKKRPYHQS